MIRPRYTLLAAGLSLLVLIGGRTAANDNTWTDAAGNFTWNTTSADWTSPTIWNNANVDGAFFGATGVGTITLATPITVRGLEFNANAYTISGSGANVLTLAHGTTGSLLDGEIQVASGFGDGVSAGIAGTVGLTKTGAGIIVLTGTNTYSGGTTVSAGGVQIGNGGTAGTLPSGNVSIANGGQFLFRLDNTSDLAVGNNFSGAGQLVFDGVNVSGHSSFQLTGNNSGYSGTLSVGPGNLNARLIVNAQSQLGTGTVSVATGSGIYFPGGTFNNAFHINGNGWAEASGVLGALRLENGATITGPVTLQSNARITDYFSGTGFISGPISGAFTLEKTGPLTIVLTGANTYGATTVTGGTLQIGNGGTAGTLPAGNVNVAGGASLTFNLDTTDLVTFGNTMSGTGQVAFYGVNNNAGNVNHSDFALTGNNAGLTGPVIVGSGAGTGAARLGITAPSQLGSGAVTVNSGSGIFLAGGTYANTFNINGIGWSEVTGMLGALRLEGNSTITGPVILQSNARFGDYISSGTISGPISGAFSLEKTGGATLTLSGTNTYTGGTTINGGMLSLGSAGAIGTTGPILFGGGTLQYSASNTTDYSSRFDSASTDYRIDTNGQTVTFASPLTGSGGLNLSNPSGGGALKLSGTNTYTGNTTVSSGTLEISGGGTIHPNNNAATVSVASGATMLLSGTQDNAIGYGGTSGGAGTQEKWVVAGSINSTGGHVQSFPVGGVTLNGGTLSGVATASPFGTYFVNGFQGAITANGTGNVINATSVGLNAPLVLNTPLAADTLTASSTLQDGTAGFHGSIVKNAAGTLTLSGTNTYTGGTTINGGMLSLGSAGAIGTTGPILFGGGTLQYSASNTTDYSSRFDSASTDYRIDTNGQVVTFASPLTGAASLTKIGGGTLVLTGANTNSGGTTINAGSILQIDAGGTTGSIAGNVLDNGSLYFDRGDSFTFPGAISGAGAVSKLGAGTLALTGANTFTGGVTSLEGTLIAAGGSAALCGGNNCMASGGNFGILSGVSNAIPDTALLTLAGGGIAGVADVGSINLGDGIVERVGSLVLGFTTQNNGLSYGSTLGTALVKSDEYFAGLGIVSVGQPGDYNGNGAVDAADYVLWRNNTAAFGGTPGGYNMWRSHFGQTAGSGPGVGVNAAVPEPGTIVMLIFAAAGWCVQRSPPY